MASKKFLYVKYRDRKLGEISEISFVIEDDESIRDIIGHMRSKRLKILEYGIEIRVIEEKSK